MTNTMTSKNVILCGSSSNDMNTKKLLVVKNIAFPDNCRIFAYLGIELFLKQIIKSYETLFSLNLF